MFQYHGTEYLGAAHGVCTILQMLLSVPASLSAAEDLSAVKSSVDYLLSIQVQTEKLFYSHSEQNEIIPQFLRVLMETPPAPWTKFLPIPGDQE